MRATEPQTKYYLGIPVKLLEKFNDGWCRAEWENGKVYRHWRAQLLNTPWGH